MARTGPRPRLLARCATSAAALAALFSVAAPAAAARPADGDRDGMPDRWERRFDLPSAKRSAGQDPDRDRLANRAEYRLRTHPRRRDTDGDGVADGVEVRRGTNPRRANSRPRRAHHPPLNPHGPVAYVDIASRGGACSDARSAALAGSPATPWCTLARAVAAAPAGALVLVRAGDYPRFAIGAVGSGSVTLRQYPGELAVLSGGTLSASGVRFEGLRITGTISVQPPARSVAFVGNNWITDGRSGGTSLNLEAGVANVLVGSNQIGQAPDVLGANAINFRSTDTRAPIADVAIFGNRIGPVAGGGDAIQAKHTQRLLIQDNEIFGLARPPGGSQYHPDAIQSLYGAEDMTIRGNFIHDIAAQGVFIQNYRGANTGLRAEHNVVARVASPWIAFAFNSAGATVKHNTIHGKMTMSGSAIELVANVATYGLAPSPEAQFSRDDYNLSQRFTRLPGPNSILGVPTFRDAANNDFTLSTLSIGRAAAPDGTDIGSHQTVFGTG